MKILLVIVMFSWLICVKSQSTNNGGSCQGSPTCQCNCGVGDYSILKPPNQNKKQGRPGKVGTPGQPGLVGPKGQKGDPGTSEDLENDLEKVKGQLQELIAWRIESSRNCYELANRGINTSGVYNITVRGRRTPVYCDMETDGGGWTVIQRRSNNEVEFYRGWNEYAKGFGELSGNFWTGLETVYKMTNSDSYELRIDIEDFKNNTAYALYSSFSVRNEAEKYRLSINGYEGTAGDSFAYHNNQRFTTKDQDNDNWSSNCALRYHGAWWYKSCHFSNLNGEYLRGGNNPRGIIWRRWKHTYYSLKKSEMKIRPK